MTPDTPQPKTTTGRFKAADGAADKTEEVELTERLEQNDDTMEDLTVKIRTEQFVQLFDQAEEAGIAFDSHDWAAISRFASTEKGLDQPVDDLSDLKVEPDVMTAYQFRRILQRARTGIRRVMEMRARYVKGPFFNNRKTRRGVLKRILKSGRASSQSLYASKIVAKQTAKRQILKPPAM